MTRRAGKLVFWVVTSAMIGALVAVLTVVDLTPRVEADFFFSSEDQAFADSRRIDDLFPGERQVIVAAPVSKGMNGGPDKNGKEAAPWLDAEYIDRIGRLTEELAAIEGVSSVRSLTSGPGAGPRGVEASPVWRRLLLAKDRQATYLIASLTTASENDPMPAIEEAVAKARKIPGFELAVSGVPYVVELIRRHLRRDVRVFSAAALLVFGVVISVLYRSWPLVVGTLMSCVGACLITLATLRFLDVPIGLLTANIATIVFVLTLSHTVFLSSNWRRIRLDIDAEAAVREAVRITSTASFWCMVAALMGFASLRLASAKPLRELGVSGLVGTTVAMVVAYGFYPAFLRFAKVRPALFSGGSGTTNPGATRRVQITLVIVALVVLAATGIRRLETDPSLFSYFAEDSDLYRGLELIDRGGGSSPLLLVVADPDGGPLDSRPAESALRAFQTALDGDPAVGMSLSLPVLLDEAKRVPFAGFFPTSKLLDILESKAFGRIAAGFVTPERDRALFYMRMRESRRLQPRGEIVARIIAAARTADLDPILVGGLFDLQSKLGELVKRSLVVELGGLLVFFVGVAFVVARSIRGALSMVLCLAAVSALLLGSMGHLGRPVDVISAPAVNVAIALGIDGMIHLLLAVRRQRASGESEEAAWISALGQMRQPILGAMAILAVGFGIFVLSSFPPTQRFGAIVAFGTLASAAMTLVTLPLVATAGRKGS